MQFADAARRLIAPAAARLCLAALTLAPALSSMAVDGRDIEFECPCRVEWENGELALTFGLRSHSATESGALAVSVREEFEGGSSHYILKGPTKLRGLPAELHEPAFLLDPLPPRASIPIRTYRFPSAQPRRRIALELAERIGEGPVLDQQRVGWWHLDEWNTHESASLWPATDDIAAGGFVRYIDLLTDSDGDGVGDVNERLAGTMADDAASTPGESVVDVLALYNDGYAAYFDGDPLTPIHHAMVVTGMLYADSGTNIRLRTVGIVEVALDGRGEPTDEELGSLIDRHGGDVSLRFHHGPNWLCGLNVGGCAGLGSSLSRGLWNSQRVRVLADTGAVLSAHELGHALGLAHSARQGEVGGAFRWSRGHYLSDLQGTIMSYANSRNPRFADPERDCEGLPCGVPIDEPDGANAVKSLDLVRFQAASWRPPKPDSDGDGVIDPLDAFPDDPREWRDTDGDGEGDGADTDADGDGVADDEDAFPFDPAESADTDGDGVGDGADADDDDDGMPDLADPFPLDPARWLDEDGDDLIPDPILRRRIEVALGKPAGAAIAPRDMATLTELRHVGERDVAPSLQISSLVGLEMAVRLTDLSLENTSVSNLSPLASLASLQHLTISGAADRGGQVRDLAPLANLTNLQILDLSHQDVADLSPLSGLTALQSLRIPGAADRGGRVRDLAPLANLTNLQDLDLSYQDVADLSPLSGLTALRGLRIPGAADRGGRVRDLAPLANLTNLQDLDLSYQDVADLSPLSGLAALQRLAIPGAADREGQVRDLRPLAGLTNLHTLDLSHQDVVDLSPLSGLATLGDLRITGAADRGGQVRDLRPLADLTNLQALDLSHQDVADLSPLRKLAGLKQLLLGSNRIADLSPLRDLTSLEFIDLSSNRIVSLAPLVNRAIWGPDDAFMDVRLNPLNPASIRRHIPALRAWNIYVATDRDNIDSANTVYFADRNLRARVAQSIAGGGVFVDPPLPRGHVARLRSLRAYNAGVADLTGLEAGESLISLWLGSNAISDLGPLADLDNLDWVDLNDNAVSDISALAGNMGLTAGDGVMLKRNPLSEESVNLHIPELLERGVAVTHDDIALSLAADGEATFDMAGFFEAAIGGALSFEATSGNPDLIAVSVRDGVLTVLPGPDGAAGATAVSVTATGTGGGSETLTFALNVRVPRDIPLVAPAVHTAREGFVRFVNYGDGAGVVRIEAIDDSGAVHGPLTLSLGGGRAVHLASGDLERGNVAKGLSAGIGAGQGAWRLELRTGAIEALAYVRTRDGFVTSMHDLVPRIGGHHDVPIFNPGSNVNQVSWLRLINSGQTDAAITVTGIDDSGALSPGAARLTVPARASRTLSASQLESGDGLSDALGDGFGKWRLIVTSDTAVQVMNLLESPGGNLTNLSTRPDMAESADAGEWLLHLPLFPSAADAKGRQGFLRLVNPSDETTTVRIAAFDDSNWDHDPVTLALYGRETVHLNSDDLELGNPAKGLPFGVGAGEGDWRLELRSDAAFLGMGYIRTRDGFVTSMHDVVPRIDDRHAVPIFNPGSNVNQVSALRLANPGEEDASATIQGIDDRGLSPGGPVRLSIPAGASRTLTSQALEAGGEDFAGALGDGEGKWRLIVTSDHPIMVMSLLASPTGHLTNLSTAPRR